MEGNSSKNKKVCSVDGCNRKHNAKGWCKSHYEQNRIYGDPLFIPQRYKHEDVCSNAKCNNEYYGKGFCRKCYDKKRQKHKGYICKWDGCNKKLADNNETGYCHPHWAKSRIKPKKYCEKYGCEKLAIALKLCRNHYNKINPRSSNHGDLDLVISMNNVRVRDNNTCQWQNCRKTYKDTTIHVHHIFPISEYPKLKYVEPYMICYCVKHHRLWHKMRGDKYWKFI